MARSGQTDKVKYGSTVRINGAVAQGSAGVPVHLERSLGGTKWGSVANTTTQNGGSYGFKIRARRSAAYRAVTQNGAAASQSRKVTVLAKVVGRAQRHVLGTHAVRVKGAMLPRMRGRTIALQQKTRRGWKTVDKTRTGRGGRFKATFHPRSHGSYRLRVKFPGDAAAAAARDNLRVDPGVQARWRVLVQRWQRCLWLAERHDGGAQDAAVWHQGHAPLPRPFGRGAGDGPWSVHRGP